MFSASGFSFSRTPSPRSCWVGCDERAPDVAVLHQPVAVGDARRPGEALGGGDARLGDGHDHVGLDRRLAGQLLAHPLPGGVDVLAVEARSRAGRSRRTRTGRASGRARRSGSGGPRLASITIISAGSISRTSARRRCRAPARLAGQHPAALEPAQHQRPEAVGVAHADEAGVVHEHEREAAPQPGQDPLQRALQVAAVGAGLVGYSRASSSATSAESVVESRPRLVERGPAASRAPRPARRCWSGCRCGPRAKPASPIDR